MKDFKQLDNILVNQVAYCEWLHAKTSTCLSFDECVDAVGLLAYKQDIESRVTRRLQTHHYVEKTKCTLERMKLSYDAEAEVSLPASSNQCESVPAPSPSLYNLHLTTVPYSTCSSDPDITSPVHPSIADVDSCLAWRQQEYDYRYHKRQVCAVRMSDNQIQCWQASGHFVNPPSAFGSAKYVVAMTVGSSRGGCAVMETNKLKCWSDAGSSNLELEVAGTCSVN